MTETTEKRFRLTVPADLQGPKGIDDQPVNSIRWIPRELIDANDYNPNRVAPPEMRLLKVSLLVDGWTQPIVVRQEGERYEVVDGYHRWLVADDKRVAAMTDGMIPAVVLKPASHEDQMMSTIRHNRARGNHTVMKMAEISVAIAESGLPDDRIMQLLQMEDEELERLKARGNMVKRGSAEEFGQGWQPA